MKTCSACNTEKSIDNFTKRSASKDGLNAACKDCIQNRDKVRYRKERCSRSEKHKEYMQTEQGKIIHSQSAKKWRGLNAEKRAAHVLVGNRVKSGKLTRQPCEMCGSEVGIHAHHDDYSQPLNIMWLCVVHHKARHAYLEYVEQNDQEAA